jgi:hypothetical protein
MHEESGCRHVEKNVCYRVGDIAEVTWAAHRVAIAGGQSGNKKDADKGLKSWARSDTLAWAEQL